MELRTYFEQLVQLDQLELFFRILCADSEKKNSLFPLD